MEIPTALADFNSLIEFGQDMPEDSIESVRRTIEAAQSLADALEGCLMPLDMYKAYGWNDPRGVLESARKSLKLWKGE